MKMTWTLRAIGLSAIAMIGAAGGHLPALTSGTNLLPMIVTNVTGNLHIQQSLPGTCDNVNQTAPLTGGRLELSPATGIDVPGGKQFVLTRASATFAPFTIERHCMLQDVTRVYSAVGVHLSRTTSFTAAEIAPGVYAFTIPKGDVQFFEGSIVNGGAEPGSMRPKEDVTGTIDFGQRRLDMVLAVATKIHFRFGCVPYVGCAVDDDYHGTLTATLSGSIALPDADRDGVTDESDNCRFFPNPDQSPVATPVITAPPDVTIASCLDREIGAPVADDVCDAGQVSVTNNAPATFVVGPNLVTWTGTDARSRTSSAAHTVTVVDTTKPIFTSVPPDIARNNCGPVDLGTPAAVDDCAGVPAFANNAPAYFLVGATTVTWTATDASQNQSTATQMVTVTDTTPPEVACSVVVGDTFRVTAQDACLGPLTVRLGSFVLADGEVIKINEVGQPGVGFVSGGGPAGPRHFHVGAGEAVITAVDQFGNTAVAACVR